MKNKWDGRFMGLAEYTAHWSKDPSTKCGAVITDALRRVVSSGYNGFAAGVSDDPDAYTDRGRKLRQVIHAELNAILFARSDLRGCTLYVWPMPPCSQCAAAIIQTGIRRVVCPMPSVEQERRWGEDFGFMRQMFNDAGVVLDLKGE